MNYYLIYDKITEQYKGQKDYWGTYVANPFNIGLMFDKSEIIKMQPFVNKQHAEKGLDKIENEFLKKGEEIDFDIIEINPETFWVTE